MPPESYILLVDDDEICHFLSRRVLSGLGFDGETVEAGDGLEACERIERLGRPLFVLLDLRMPRMDGHALLATLATGKLCEPPPVFVSTSSARPEDVRLAESYPFVGAYFEKPLRRGMLPEIIRTMPEAPFSRAA